jgi:hypothetical protein
VGSAWRAHAARTKRTDDLVDRRDDEVKRATSYRCHISRSPRSQESERQPVAEVMTRSATGGRRLPSYEARTYGRRDAFSGRRCAAKAGWTGAAAPVQSAERAPRPPSPQINLRLYHLKTPFPARTKPSGSRRSAPPARFPCDQGRDRRGRATPLRGVVPRLREASLCASNRIKRRNCETEQVVYVVVIPV